jgi:hypothetical protein
MRWIWIEAYKPTIRDGSDRTATRDAQAAIAFNTMHGLCLERHV